MLTREQDDTVVLDNICYNKVPQLIPVVDADADATCDGPFSMVTFDDITQLGDL